MTESEIITTISTMAREIDLLRYRNRQLEEANRNLIDQIEHLHVEIHIAKGDGE